MILSRTKGWIGVDLGTHTVKLAQIERRGGRYQLVEALILRRHETWRGDNDTDGELASTEEIRAALSLGGRFSGNDAGVVLPMCVCDVRACRLEPEEVDPQAAVLGELDAVYGNTLATHDFDYWQFDVDDNGAAQADNTLAMAVPLAWTSRVARDMTEVGLVGHVLDGLPLTLARAVALSSPSLSQPVIALDWGQRNATLCVVRKGQPVFVRGLRDSGFANVVESICRSLDVTGDETQKLLRDCGLPDRTSHSADELQLVIEEVAREPLTAFIEELNRTITFLNQQRRSIAPAKLVLFGGGAAVKNIANYFQGKVELPVEVWRLGGDRGWQQEHLAVPIEMLGPAIALSSLAWTT